MKLEDIRLTRLEKANVSKDIYNKLTGSDWNDMNMCEEAIANTATDKAIKKIVDRFDDAEINSSTGTRIPSYERIIESLRELIKGGERNDESI